MTRYSGERRLRKPFGRGRPRRPRPCRSAARARDRPRGRARRARRESGRRCRCWCRSSARPGRPRRGWAWRGPDASGRRRRCGAGGTRSRRRCRRAAPSARPRPRDRGRRDGPARPSRRPSSSPAFSAGVLEHLLVEPVELAVGRCRPDVVGHGGGERAELRLAVAQGLLGAHPLGGLDHDREHAGRLAALVEQWAVVEVDPDVLGPAGAIEDQMLVAERQRFPAQAGLHHPAVEVCDLGPAFQHLRAKQLRVAPAGKDRIGIVVDHDAVAGPTA